MIRNERFRVALDYLYKNGLVADQRELSVKTISGAPFKANRATEYSGNLFGSGGTLDVSVNEAWETALERTW